jgi:hypothetical protein
MRRPVTTTFDEPCKAENIQRSAEKNNQKAQEQGGIATHTSPLHPRTPFFFRISRAITIF